MSIAQLISRENDRTLQAQGIVGVSLAAVGTASWGKFNEKIVCGDEAQLISNAGYPISQDPNSIFYIGKQFLKVSQGFTYIRVGDGTEDFAKVDLEDDQTTPEKSIEIKAIYKGTFGNRLKVKIEDGTKENTKKLSIYITNTQGVDIFQKAYDNLVKTVDSVDYYMTKINGTNDYIEVVDTITNTNHPADATYVLAGGDDGNTSISDADYIGTITGTVKTGLKLLANREENQYTMIAVPAITSQAVHSEMLTLATNIYSLALIDGPKNQDLAGIQDWFNGTGSFSGQSAYDNSNGATDWDWTLVKDEYNDEDIYLPPSVGLAFAIGFSYTIGGLDLAPTGHKRGKLTFAKGVAYNPSKSEADVLQSNGNRINPVINFSGRGVTRWGNDTMQRAESALVNIHSRLILNNIKQTIERAIENILFDPNENSDDGARREFINIVEPVCEQHKTNRGIADYRVISDSSNNSLQDVSQEIFRGSIEIIFTPKIKTIYIDYILLPTGTVLTERTV